MYKLSIYIYIYTYVYMYIVIVIIVVIVVHLKRTHDCMFQTHDNYLVLGGRLNRYLLRKKKKKYMCLYNRYKNSFTKLK